MIRLWQKVKWPAMATTLRFCNGSMVRAPNCMKKWTISSHIIWTVKEHFCHLHSQCVMTNNYSDQKTFRRTYGNVALSFKVQFVRFRRINGLSWEHNIHYYVLFCFFFVLVTLEWSFYVSRGGLPFFHGVHSNPTMTQERAFHVLNGDRWKHEKQHLKLPLTNTGNHQKKC